MDDTQRAFIETFRTFLEEVVQQQRAAPTQLTPLGEVVQEHLGTLISELPVVSEQIALHRYVDADVALEVLGAEGRLLGVTGGQQRFHEQLPELLSHQFVRFGPGPVDYGTAAVGVDEQRQIVVFGMRLFTFDGEPVVTVQRTAAPQFGRETATVEVLSADPARSGRLLTALRRLMVERSVLRGKVLSFESGEFGPHASGAVFLARPSIAAEEVILPPGILESVTGHVTGISDHRQRLLDAGRHLKRGVLLYGPPGTGKTLTVRHLIGTSEGVTTVLLTGSTLRFIREATELARAMQPAMVVLEDVDLVAMERTMHGGPQPLLFMVLDALDGLDGDADVVFLLTTNRVDTLEPALAERPGRVDLAVEIPLPDEEARRRLFALYARELPLSADAVAAAATRA
ncbi:MAG TPA: ATP-binding protein, partial [Naasia sp.]